MNGVVGLTGFARSGKDTVADLLVSEFDYVKLPFAKPLKEMAKRINPIIGHEVEAQELHTMQSRFEGKPIKTTLDVKPVYLLDALNELGEDETKSRYPEYRRFLQHLGTDGIRHVEDGFWIRQWVTEAYDALESGKNVVVPDVRFPNEAEAIRGIGELGDLGALGVVAQVWRAGLINVDAHESEKHVGAMGEIATLNNSRNISDLHFAAANFARSLPWA